MGGLCVYVYIMRKKSESTYDTDNDLPTVISITTLRYKLFFNFSIKRYNDLLYVLDYYSLPISRKVLIYMVEYFVIRGV